MLAALGVSPNKGKITRSHVIVEKGGKVSEVALAVKSSDSMPDALKFVTTK